jgi:CheY-like chemotaxis protein
MKAIQVLLIEDNAGDALVVGQALADCPRPVILTTARDGEQGLAILADRGYNPALIILDLNMPKLPGHLLLQRYDAAKTSVVVFSAYWNDVDLDRAFALGVREYVHKPMDLDAFKQAVCNMVEKWAFPPGPQRPWVNARRTAALIQGDR